MDARGLGTARSDADWRALAEALLALTREAHALAVAGDWEQVAVVQTARQAQLDLLLDRPVPPPLVDELARQLADVLALDQALRQLAQAQHQELQQQVGSLQRGKLAVATYQAISE